LGQKGNLFLLKLSITWPSLEIFGHKEDCVLYFDLGAQLAKPPMPHAHTQAIARTPDVMSHYR
jgi:hypothetical protein